MSERSGADGASAPDGGGAVRHHPQGAEKQRHLRVQPALFRAAADGQEHRGIQQGAAAERPGGRAGSKDSGTGGLICPL